MSDHKFDFPKTTVRQVVLAVLGGLFAPLLVIVMIVRLLIGIEASHIPDTDPKAAAAKVVDAFTSTVTTALKKGDTVTLIGFGTFAVSKRAARTGRNPQTGKELKIPARKAPAFRAGKALKDAVNK